MTKKYEHLSVEECQRHISLLRIFGDIFNGTLGMWNSKPMNLELMGNTNT